MTMDTPIKVPAPPEPRTPSDSVRYDLTFLEGLIRYTDAQLDAQNNPDQSAPSLEQERSCQESLMTLCDMIDLYCEKRIQGSREEAA